MLKKVRYGLKNLEISVQNNKTINIESLGQHEGGKMGCSIASIIFTLHLLLKIDEKNNNTELFKFLIDKNKKILNLENQIIGQPKKIYLQIMASSINYPMDDQKWWYPANIRNNIKSDDLKSIPNILEKGPIIATLNKFRFNEDLGHTLVIFSSIIDQSNKIWIVGMDPDAQSKYDTGRFCIIDLNYLISCWREGHLIENVYNR